MWSFVAAGAVTINPNNLPNWFNEQNSSPDSHIDVDSAWRKEILEKLRQRQEKINELTCKAKYEKAVELSSWIKSAEARYQRPSSLEFEDCLIELEWVSGSSASTPTSLNPTTQKDSDSGTFTVLNPDGVTTKIQFSLSAITCIMCCSEPASPRLAIHVTTLVSSNCSPVRLLFSSDAEMEDWLSHLTSVCCQINEVMAKPANNSIWTTTDLGDVFVFDPANMKAQQWDNVTNSYKQEMDVTTLETPYYNTLYNG